MPVILLRHTRPAAGPGLCYGRTDLGLGPTFEAEAAAALAALPAAAAVTTSPLARCRRLAERIAAARRLPLAVDARLAEIDFGAWEGRAWTDLPRAELDAWAADFQHARPHGGESVAMLAARVAAALAEVAPGPPPTLWVAHGGVARAAAALTGRAQCWDTRLAFGQWLDLRGPPTGASGRRDRRAAPAGRSSRAGSTAPPGSGAGAGAGGSSRR